MSFTPSNNLIRKIIHIDMDCFYAAIEIRDNPSLATKPIAVGGKPHERSVLCTCNYIARKFGIHSAMSSTHALRLCPDLIILPVNMAKYREASQAIHSIFNEYTSQIEPLSLDEAYLDVSGSQLCQGSATLIAEDIRKKIYSRTGLTASAGVAPNKFLAKIASGWNKPDGIFVIHPNNVRDFIHALPAEKLFGVGKVTAEKLKNLGLKTCEDLRKVSLFQLIKSFGKFGNQLYDQCRGIDDRPVNTNRLRKSLSVEKTFLKNIPVSDCEEPLIEIYQRLFSRIQNYAPERKIKNQYIKIKTCNFKQFTIEKKCDQINLVDFQKLFDSFAKKEPNPIRLLGMGVHFQSEDKFSPRQSSFFN